MNITAKEAHSLLMNKFSEKLKALQCFEYNEIFVFKAVPKSFVENNQKGVLLDCLWSVNKKTGEIRDFKPFYISLKDYKNGKEIKDFK